MSEEEALNAARDLMAKDDNEGALAIIKQYNLKMSDLGLKLADCDHNDKHDSDRADP